VVATAWPGTAPPRGGIVLDLSGLTGLEVDLGGRTAWAQGGLTAGAYTAAVGQHGLATGFGDTGSVGIAG
jgi:FAD/FMN-containing dehydrogenase